MRRLRQPPQEQVLFNGVVAHLSEKMLQCNNIYARRRANLLFPVKLKPQKWVLLANTFLAPGPRGVAALVPISDDKIQIILLTMGLGAFSSLVCCFGSILLQEVTLLIRCCECD